MISEDNIYNLAELFKVFGDSTRIRILLLLQEKEANVNEIANELNMNQSAISHQLKNLKQSKLIKNRREEASEEPEDLMPEEMKEVVKDKIRTEMAFAEEDHDDSTETLAAEEVAAAPIEKVEEVEEQIKGENDEQI